jgi:hypothetical protein
MWNALVHRLHREEEGVAMLMAVVLTSVIATLAVTTLAVSTHSDQATARGRHFTQALHVAESGVNRAMAAVQEANGALKATDCTSGASVTSCSFTGATEEGTYDVTVTRQARNRYQIDSTGKVNEGNQLSSERSLRVTLAPPRSFSNALFSYTTVETKNNDVVTGDIWANDNVILADGTEVEGSINAAGGYILLNNGAHVSGDATSGKYDESSEAAIYVNGGASIDGLAKASVMNPPNPQTCGEADPNMYTVFAENNATIGGGATTWGSIGGGGSIAGPITQNVCTTAPAPIPMPAFTYSAANYDAATLYEFGTTSTPSATAVADFETWLSAHGDQIAGTFHINQMAPVSQNTRIDLTHATITGDLSIITNTPIYTNGTEDLSSISDGLVLLASTYEPPQGSSCDVNQDNSECAAHIKNNFAVCDPSGSDMGTAVLVYTPYGPAAVKNNALQCGAIYADSIQIKNNQTLEYDPRVERLVGFGDVTLDVVRWLEVQN